VTESAVVLGSHSAWEPTPHALTGPLKAVTEMVNFAQGDLMMLGAFVALTLVGTMGMDYWLGFLLAALIMAAFGHLLDALVLRRIIGQPQFAWLCRSARSPVRRGRKHSPAQCRRR
jgi:Branched-chain amino acid transport system / permease component